MTLPKGGQEVLHPTSYVETLLHVLKGNIGSGMFAMGEAFKYSGIALGPILTIVLGFICIYNNHVLLNAERFVKEKFDIKYGLSFSETVELSFQIGPSIYRKMASAIRIVVKVFVVITQLGFSCVYIVVVSDTLHGVLKDRYNYVQPEKEYMAIIFLPVLLTSLITSLKFLSPISFGSNLCVIGSAFMTIYYASKDGLPEPSTLPLVGQPQNLPIFLGMIIYSFEGIGLILPLKNEMKKPEQFGMKLGVLNVGLSIVCFMLVLVGFIGYLRFGDNVKGSLSLNIPSTDWMGFLVQIVFSIGLLFTYPLQFYVAAEIVWNDVNDKFGPFKMETLGVCITRSVLVILTFIVAVGVPNISLFISLIGSVCATALALVFPALMDIALRTGVHKMTTPYQNFRFAMDTITLILAIVGFVTGTYSNISSIIHPTSDSQS